MVPGVVDLARVDEEEGSLLRNRVNRMEIRENRKVSGSPPDRKPCLYLSQR